MNILFIVIGIVCFYFILIYNIILKKLKQCEQAQSNIDVFLQKRFDLIPNLIEITKNYMTHEEKVLIDIANLRKDFLQAQNNLNKKGELNRHYNELLLIIENYPVLKADTQFLNLQRKLSQIENELQAVRRIYNNHVAKYNTLIMLFPNNLLNYIWKFKEKDFFEATLNQ